MLDARTEALMKDRDDLESRNFDMRLKLEVILNLITDAHDALGVRKNFRHSDRTNDFVGSEDDENAIDAAADTLSAAIKRLSPLAGY